MDYKPLEVYGIIGNLETCPFVGRDGSINWCCFPQLESSSVFAALLDDEDGGCFAIQPTPEFTADQAYVDRTTVLQTHFQTDAGAATLTDFMPVVTGMQLPHTPHAIYRKLTCTEGSIKMGVEFDPRFDFARAPTTVERSTGGVVARGGGQLIVADAFGEVLSVRSSILRHVAEPRWEDSRIRNHVLFVLGCHTLQMRALVTRSRHIPMRVAECDVLSGRTLEDSLGSCSVSELPGDRRNDPLTSVLR